MTESLTGQLRVVQLLLKVLQQALEVELSLLVQLLHAVRPAPRAEHVHALLPWRPEVGRSVAAAAAAAAAVAVDAVAVVALCL